MDWKKLIGNLLPIKLRESKLLYALLWCATWWLRDRYDYAKKLKDDIIADMQYTSQAKSLLQMLNNLFDKDKRRITIREDEIWNATISGKDSYITICGGDENIILARNTEDCSRYIKIVLQVPKDIDEEQVMAVAKKYAFYGRNFETEYITE